MGGVCYTMQPGTVEVALRNVGTIRDFADAARTAAGAAVLTRRPGLGETRGQLEVATDTTGVAGGVEPSEPTNG